jgi:hypothetical protein
MREVVFANELPAAIQTARAATEARKRHATGDFSEPSAPVEYPRCRHCGAKLLFGVCPLPECIGKDAVAPLDRIDAESGRSE